ncbi:major facilitator superfamily multidrug-resistance, DHA1 sub-family [Mycena alexandri]|uniref:Major facilitator superfamily multidrug-resistance, DHA1 sub-family n=1 Tax=Mycena alexandri TaxID=1745969 RepID=A0AAD6T5P4_9AGAR|nr:major facilitator superfamily multidrug-resistance, DHA1 sub-family [Mycena alexandri]
MNENREGDRTRRTRIPKFQVGIVLLIQFAEPVTALVIYPFVIQFVRDTGITGGEETKTGFYAGMLESVFFLAECLTVFSWGRLSDIYGRRPVLLLGPLGLGLSMLGFGLSKKFWFLFVFRCIQGICNGNIGVSKTVINEISDSTNIADIFSIMPLVWAVGVTIAPFIGGVFSNPAAKWPETLGKLQILIDHPYYLPCLIAGSVAFLSFVLALVGLNEVGSIMMQHVLGIYGVFQTLPSIIARRRGSPPIDTDPLLPAPPQGTQEAPLPVRELLTRPVLIAMANHGLLYFCNMSNDSLIPLFFSTPISLGGLGLKPYDIGLIMGLCGFCNAIIQLLFGGRLIRRYGPRRMFMLGICAIFTAFTMYPLMSFLAQRAGRVDSAVLAVLACQLSCSFLIYFAYSSMMILIMDAAPTPASLGSVNGLSGTVGTLFRSLAPSFASSLFAFSAEHQILGGNMVYFVLMVITLGALRCASLLPRTRRSESKAQARLEGNI